MSIMPGPEPDSLFAVNNSSVRALDAERTENQRGLIFAALLDGERFNSIEARNRWGCDRLSARIEELRKRGYRICADIGEDRRATYWIPKDEIERIRGANP